MTIGSRLTNQDGCCEEQMRRENENYILRREREEAEEMKIRIENSKKLIAKRMSRRSLSLLTILFLIIIPIGLNQLGYTGTGILITISAIIWLYGYVGDYYNSNIIEERK